MIKNKLYIGLSFLLAFLMACEDEPGDFFPYEKAITEITFENYAGFSAEFTSVDNIQITVNSSNEAINELQVFVNLAYINEEGDQDSDRALVGTLPLTAGVGTLDVSLDEVFAETGATVDNLNELTLDFVAEQGGESTYRRFDVDVIDPLTIEGPEAGYNDSVATFLFNYITVNELIDNIQFFTRLEGEEDFVAADIIGINDLTGQGDFLFNLPSEEDLPVGSVVTVRSVLTTQQGRVYTIEEDVEIIGFPLGEAQTFTLNAADTSGYSLIDQTDTIPADADIRLGVRETIIGDRTLVLRPGDDSGTTFVRVSGDPDFAGATFQDIRDEFEAAAAEGEAMEEIDLSASPTDAVYVAKLGQVPADPEEDLSRYALFRVADLMVEDPLEESTATIEYRVTELEEE